MAASTQFVAKLKIFQQSFVGNASAALYAETELLATQVKYRTPVDTGTLRASIHVEGPVQLGNMIATSIVAGGPAAPYAIFVHERPAHHAVGQWKFIESVIDENAFTIIGRIAARMFKANATGGNAGATVVIGSAH